MAEKETKHEMMKEHEKAGGKHHPKAAGKKGGRHHSRGGKK